MDTVFDVAFVGSGPAGKTAAIYAARAKLRVLLIGKLAPGGQNDGAIAAQSAAH